MLTCKPNVDDCVQRNSAANFVAPGLYTRSFCELLSTDAVNIFSSVN